MHLTFYYRSSTSIVCKIIKIQINKNTKNPNQKPISKSFLTTLVHIFPDFSSCKCMYIFIFFCYNEIKLSTVLELINDYFSFPINFHLIQALFKIFVHTAIRIRVLLRETDNKVIIKIKFTTAMGGRARVKPWLNSSSQVSKELFTLNIPQQALWFDHVSNISFSFNEGSPSHTLYNKISLFCIKSKLHLEIN